MDRETARAIEWDCTQLVIRFYGALDGKRYQDLVGLFTEDGVWVRLGKELVGPKNMLAEMNERDDWLTAHIVSNIEINIVDADRVETSQYVTLYRHEGWDPAVKGPAPVILPMGILHHRDQIVRDGGVWKFKRKTSRAVMVNRERITHYEKK
jgi:hypothetical protein